MNLNLEGRSSKLAWGLGICGSLVFIVASTYWTSPTIEDSLESQDFKLISKFDERTGLYERSFSRNRNILIAMNLDGFMSEKTGDDEGAVALNMWCDLNLSRRHWFISLDGYKKFCALSMGDVLWLEKKHEKIIDDSKFYKLEQLEQKFSKELFPKFGLVWDGSIEKMHGVWKSWCEWELSEPYYWKSRYKKNEIKTNCLGDAEKP